MEAESKLNTLKALKVGLALLKKPLDLKSSPSAPPPPSLSKNTTSYGNYGVATPPAPLYPPSRQYGVPPQPTYNNGGYNNGSPSAPPPPSHMGYASHPHQSNQYPQARPSGAPKYQGY